MTKLQVEILSSQLAPSSLGLLTLWRRNYFF